MTEWQLPRFVCVHRNGGTDVLELEECEVDAPGPDEVQIEVRALGLNRAEALFRQGRYVEQAEFPSGSGLEAAGVIKLVGESVTGFAVGDRVALIPPISMRERPVHAEVVNYPATNVVKTPWAPSFEVAAATWMAFLTAYGGMVATTQIERNDHVVITAASSSVGIAAIQIAKLIGAIPIAISRSQEKRSALIEAGAAQVVLSESEHVAEAIRKLAGRSGVRLFFDAVGGDLLPQLVEAAEPGGIIVSYGAQDGNPSQLPAASLLAKSLTLRGYLVHELIRDAKGLRAAVAFISQGMSSGQLRPTIDRVFPLSDIRAAYEHLESGKQFGKIVVRI